MAYFKPLRRKLGIITILMGCAFAGLWFRSFASEDIFSLHTGAVVSCIISMRGNLSYERTWPDKSNFPDLLGYDSLPSWRFSPGDSLDQFQKVEEFRFLGVHTVRGRTYASRGQIYDPWGYPLRDDITSPPTINGDGVGVSASHWFVIIPLTLLSAWLLFSKPRVKLGPTHV